MAKYKAQKMIVKPSGKNGECITIVKGSKAKAKAKGLTKSQIKRIRIKETLNRQVPTRAVWQKEKNDFQNND